MKKLNNVFKLNNQKGFTGVDLMIAMGVITILVPIITTIYLNTFYTVSSTQKKSIATNLAVEIFEKLEVLSYDEIILGTIIVDYDTTETNRKIYEVEVPNNYYCRLEIIKYDAENTIDLVKNVGLEIKYKVGDNEISQYFSRNIEREKLQTVNPPILDTNKIAVKYINGNWIKTDETDSQWYNYEAHNWAIAMEKSTAIINENNTISFYGDPIFYVWIPRYALNSNGDVKFLNEDTNKYVTLETITEEGAKVKGNILVLKDLPEGYNVHSAFKLDEEELKGVWLENHSDSDDNMPDVFDILYHSRYGEMIDENNLFSPFPEM